MRCAMILALSTLLAAFVPLKAQADSPVAQSQAALAWKLLQPAKPGQDALVSPASLASAFAALDLAADARMKNAIFKTLGFPAQSPGDAEKQLFAARKALTDADPAVFVTADRLVFPPQTPPSAGFLADLDRRGVSHVAADTTKPEAIRSIDGWVSEVTKGKIPQILGAPMGRPSFVSLNALYFKGKWDKPFDLKATAEAPFHTIDGAAAPVILMHLPISHRQYRAEGQFVGVDLPFAGGRYSLTVLTSTDKPRALAEFGAVASWLSGEGFSSQDGDLALPRFSLQSKADLLPTLLPDLADGLRSPTALAALGPQMSIDAILQIAKIDVDEEGAEAAAATAIVMRALAMAPRNPLHMVVDKPYLFALRDNQSGLILIAGYVANAPKGAKS